MENLQHIQAPDLTIGARKTPSLKSSEVRCSNLGRFVARGGGEDEYDRLDIVFGALSVMDASEGTGRRRLKSVGSLRVISRLGCIVLLDSTQHVLL